MSYEIVLVRSAKHEFQHLPTGIYDRITAVLQHLRQEPFPHGARKLSQGSGWRIRVGDYRILYTIDENTKLITVHAIGHRRDVYRRK